MFDIAQLQHKVDTCLQAGDYIGAAQLLEQLIAINPKSMDIKLNYANVLSSLGDYNKAIDLYREILPRRDLNLAALIGLAYCSSLNSEHENAVSYITKAIKISSQKEVLNTAGLVYKHKGDFEKAKYYFSSALNKDSNFSEARFNLGAVYAALGNSKELDQLFTESSRSNTQGYREHLVRAELYRNRGDRIAAFAEYEKCFSLAPRVPELYEQLVNFFWEIFDFENALYAVDRALKVSPGKANLLVMREVIHNSLCDWSGNDINSKSLYESDQIHVSPFLAITLLDRPEWHLKIAKKHAGDKDRRRTVGNFDPSKDRKKIRVGYASGDFRAHAVAYLIVGMLEHHDRERFEILGINTGPLDESVIGERVRGCFDQWIDIHKDEKSVAIEKISAVELDLIVDLSGHTSHNKFYVLREINGPLLINFLGYPGTIGAQDYDYIVADEIVIPPENYGHFSESICTLPICYQPNDQDRQIAEVATTKNDHNLEPSYFTFACFNQLYKLRPDVVLVWIDLLREFPSSQLWLLRGAELAMKNLIEYFENHGIDKKRIVFAPILPNDRHLERLRHADLFLDTLPYNAHTTASDALFSGVPVITVSGRSFAARVAKSILTTLNLPELCASNLIDYKQLARRYMTDGEFRKDIRKKLNSTNIKLTLYNSKRQARTLELAYESMLMTYLSWGRSVPVSPIVPQESF